LIHQDRLNWIISNVKGRRMLDVGCSQGGVSIFLARNGKMVEGIDKDKESIEFALMASNSESEETRNNLTFRTADFLSYHFVGLFDTVILSLRLDGPTDIDKMLEKARDLVGPEGRLLIDVPFGLSDLAGADDVEYGSSMTLKISRKFIITDLVVIDSKYLCYSCEARTPDEGQRVRLEEFLQIIERGLLERERRILLESDRLRSTIQDMNNASRTIHESLRNSQQTTEESFSLMRAMQNDQKASSERYQALFEKQTKEAADLERRLEWAKDEKERISLESSRIGAELFSVKGDLVRLRDEKRRLESELVVLGKEIASLRSVQSEMMAQMDSLRNELHSKEWKLEESHASLEQARARIGQMEKESSIMHKDLQTKGRELERVKLLYESDSKKLKEVTKKLEKELTEEERMLHEVERLQKRNKVLIDRYDTLANSILGKMMIYIWGVYNRILGKAEKK
jgi:2-polyprenyl-3-methyl-5-hydroxy-6-metoxy-1,4-benzoquinol methylase